MSEQPERPLFSAEEFFAQQPPPPQLEEHLEQVREFVERNMNAGKRVVLVTSGGTTVPLEQNVVRFLDNFSAGTRGSASAEHFLRTGNYAVIFLHRQHSLQPFSRHYSHSTNPFLDLLSVVHENNKDVTPVQPKDGFLFPPVPAASTSSSVAPTDSSAQIHISPPHLAPMLSLLQSYQLVKSLGVLHSIAFTTVDEYLWLLRGVSRVMSTARDKEGNALGRRGMYYLAAAVSDFFIPSQRVSEHKIQSGKGSLSIEMDQVPKVLKAMVDEWANDGFVVSFKLETDIKLLIPKALGALDRYGHQVVIGNTLADRKYEVVFVERSGETWVRIAEEERGKVGADGAVREIEEDIIERLERMHSGWIASGKV
ncbi:DNA/pantothenate metabolism flavo protein [Leucosporidium creatinivorum]|uniref:DNA/pantothenate metabolism flavo protein n=1 Tax=Leucosporidium creatinivorum TaxID=106004 RepID=A0A1Y2F5W3_9BASI|nr:DNA/pantothenate metabolism flavo protein [Leucosporidium creatinivorum]